MMGVDWRDQTWWSYQALMFDWNERHSEGGGAPDLSKLKRAMAAQAVH
jgi:hypothetical protein